MLALQLRDFVIVDSLELEFGPGFTVLSGETGAGKSILLDALALVTGARADPGVVREGCARADIAAQFRTDASLDSWLAERELAGDAGVVLLRRVIDADGRSRALVNGQPATAALLREIGERLLDIHGQHAAQSLLRADGPDRGEVFAFLREARDLAGGAGEVRILGPAAAAMERRAGRYRAQLLLESPARGPLQRLLDAWLPQVEALKAPRRIRWSMDVDPIEVD